MAESITGQVSSVSSFIHQNPAPLSITYTGVPKEDYQRFYGATEVSKIYFNNYAITSGGTTIDLTSLTDAYGNAVSFATISHLQIVNNDTTNNLSIGGGTHPLFALLPFTLNGAAQSTTGAGSTGSCLNLTGASLTVSAGSTNNLLLAASAGTISVDVFIVGN